MAKSTKGAKGLGKALQGKKPKGGSSSTGKGKQQDIELGGETRPAAGARSPGGSSAVPLDKQISELLTKNGDLKDKSPEAVQKLTQLIGRWEVNETTRLADLGNKTAQGSVLKYLKKSGNQEMYVSALAKSDGTLPTTALKKDYDTLVGGTQSKAPNESRPKVNNETVTFRPEGRPNRLKEAKGNIDPNPTSVERLEKVGQRMDADAASDDDYLYALGQGYGPNNIDAELARIQTITDANERQQAILALAQNTTQSMGRGDNATTIKVGQWLDQYLNKTAQPTAPKGGGAKVGDGPLPGEKQQSLDFDGGGDAKTEGPEIPVNEPELKQPNQAANATGTENVPPEPKEPFEAQTVPPAGDVGDSKLEELKNWAINSIRQEVEFKMGGSVDSDPAIQKKYDSLVNEFLNGIDGDPDAIAKLQKLKEGSQPASTEAPQPQPNRQTPNQAASPGNQTRNTTQPVQPGTTPQPGKSVNPPMAPPKGIVIPPGYKGPTPGKGGQVGGMKTGGKSEPPQKGMSPDEWKARAAAKEKEFDALDAKINKDRRLGAASAAAAGVAGSLAWNWLAGGDDEPEVQPSASSASITGGPSTSTGSASGSVADGSGGSSGGMSQEQMENLMKLQQIRDEQKRRFIGTGSGAQGVYR